MEKSNRQLIITCQQVNTECFETRRLARLLRGETCFTGLTVTRQTSDDDVLVAEPVVDFLSICDL